MYGHVHNSHLYTFVNMHRIITIYINIIYVCVYNYMVMDFQSSRSYYRRSISAGASALWSQTFLVCPPRPILLNTPIVRSCRRNIGQTRQAATKISRRRQQTATIIPRQFHNWPNWSDHRRVQRPTTRYG